MDFSHKFELPKRLHYQQEQWCIEKFGPRWNAIDYRDGTWTVFWSGTRKPRYYTWYFKNEPDAALFALRWASS